MSELFEKHESATTACPNCGWTGPAIGEPEDLVPPTVGVTMQQVPTLQLAGCCDGQVMCPKCATEFDPETGRVHEGCDQCAWMNPESEE